MKALCIIFFLFFSHFSSPDFVWSNPAPQPVEQHDSATKIVGKSVATAAVASFTGGVLLAALRVIKWAEALNNPVSFVFIAGALLYSQHKIVEEFFGPDYTFPSSYTSLVTMLGMAGVIIYHNDK